jgi:hypothetical protein
MYEIVIKSTVENIKSKKELIKLLQQEYNGVEIFEYKFVKNILYTRIKVEEVQNGKKSGNKS